MKWLDGQEFDTKDFTREMYNYDHEQWLECDEPLKTALFIIDFDTELTMGGIYAFLENSIGHYAPQIIRSFRNIGDNTDAEILSEICRLAPPDMIRGELLETDHKEYDIYIFDEVHGLKEEIADKISELEEKLYLNSDSDIWSLLFAYMDSYIMNK